ncbi:hypothetical protein [Halomonas cerina]|uniref:Uncharacterized protein n=1 Tax=Halomonas cerina TaxID=447424 RepID=A0A839VDA9_9GAMM|nr:hypothetical protein [Halomonas cerina]MBB3190654.1 hypothetical protein [Halomonas cerina]
MVQSHFNIRNVAILILILAALLWFWLFEDTHLDMLAADDIVQFAIYYGGVMTPIIALISLMAFLRTLGQQNYLIKQQEEQLKNQKEQLKIQEEQLSSLKRDAEKTGIFQVVDRLDRDLNELAKSRAVQVKAGKGCHAKTVFDLLKDVGGREWNKLPECKKFGPRQEAIMNGFDIDPEEDESVKAWDTASMAAIMLTNLRLYLEKHDELAENSVLSKYYALKYQTFYYRLARKGYLEKEDMPTEIQEGTHEL